jgi:hypothetical protein
LNDNSCLLYGAKIAKFSESDRKAAPVHPSRLTGCLATRQPAVAALALVLTLAGWQPTEAPVLAIAPAPPSPLFLPPVLPLERLRVVELRAPADLLIPAAQALALLCPDARARTNSLPHLQGTRQPEPWGAHAADRLA